MKLFNEGVIVHLLKNLNHSKTGYLCKKAKETKKNSKRRYFVLIGNILVYYDKKPINFDIPPKGIVILEDYLVELCDDDAFAFKICFGNDVCIVLLAESEGDMKDWFRAVFNAGLDMINLPELEETRSHNYSANSVTSKIFQRNFHPFMTNNLSQGFSNNSKGEDQSRHDRNIGKPNQEIEFSSEISFLLGLSFDEMHEMARSNFES